MTFVVEGEPVGKGRARSAGNVHYTPAKTRAAEKRVLQAFQAAGGKTIDGAIKVRFVLFYGVARSLSKKERTARLNNEVPCCKKPDGDNVEKLLNDALPFAKSDQQIVEACWKKLWSDRPRMEVEILPWQ